MTHAPLLKAKPAPRAAVTAPSRPLGTRGFGVLQRKCSCEGPGKAFSECAECKAERGVPLQRQNAGRAEPTAVPPIVHEVLRSPGQPLDAATRAYMEPRFGHDFSKVRVHADAKADESARAVGALAYTVGPHVVFQAGQYAPEMGDRRQLLAHELTHVVQQGEGEIPGRLVIGPSGDKHEQEADIAAQDVVQRPPGGYQSGGVQLQRQTAADTTAANTGSTRAMSVPQCTDKPPPAPCSVCILPPQGVKWFKGPGPYIAVGSRGQVVGVSDETLAQRELKRDDGCPQYVRPR